MALSDKDIIITPNRGQAADPKIEFRGAQATLGPQTISLQTYPQSGGTLSFEGSQGQLLSITNTLSGSIYQVNDIQGIPSIEVLDTGIIKLGQYSGSILIGQGSDVGGHKLQVQGNVSIQGPQRLFLADFSDATLPNRLMFQSNVSNGATNVQCIPNGTSTSSSINLYSSTGVQNQTFAQLQTTGTEVRLSSGATGTATQAYLPLTLHTGGLERARFDISGNLGIGTTVIGSNGITLTQQFNIGWQQGAGQSIPNIFRLSSSAATVIANGYRYSDTANGFASSYSVSWPKSAIALREGSIRFYTDTATTVAAGTDVVASERMIIDTNGRVGISITPSYTLDVLGNAFRIVSSSADATIKVGAWVQQSFTNAHGVFTAAYPYSTSGVNGVAIGGGTSSYNAATEIGFYTASNTTTVTGTERLRIDSSGNVRVSNQVFFSSQFNAGNSGTSITINFTNGQKQLLALTGNATVTFSFPGVGNYQLLLTQDATGSRTVTWSGVSRYVGSATAPAINTAANTQTVVSVYWDGSNAWLAAQKVNA